MSVFDPVMRITKPREEVDFIVPERIREACAVRMLDYKEAAEKCELPPHEFGLMANGHMKEIPQEYIFNLMKGLDFPAKFFYFVRWERT